jgi:hypothetical protein
MSFKSLGGWLHRLVDNAELTNILDTNNFYISMVCYKMLPGQNCEGHNIHGKTPLESVTPNSVKIYVVPNNKYNSILKKKLGLDKDIFFRQDINTEDKINYKKTEKDPDLFEINLDILGKSNFRKLITIDPNKEALEELKGNNDSSLLIINQKIDQLKSKKFVFFINPQFTILQVNKNNTVPKISILHPISISAGINHNLEKTLIYYGASLNYLYCNLESKQASRILKEVSKEFNTDNDGEYYQRVTFAENIQETITFQVASVGATLGLNINLEKDKNPITIEYSINAPVLHTFNSVNTAGSYTTGGIYPNYLTTDTLFSSKPNFVKSQQFDRGNSKLNYMPQIMHRIGFSWPLCGNSKAILSLTGNYTLMNFQNMNIRDELFGSDPGAKYYSLLTTQNNLRIQNISLGCNFKYKF